MTILKPNLKQKYIKSILGLTAVLSLGGLIYILEYNSLVDARFNVRAASKQIAEIQKTNSELQNQIFKITDLNNLKTEAEVQALVLEKTPRYVSIK